MLKIKKIFKIILIAVVLFLISSVLSFHYGKFQCHRMIDAIRNDNIKKLEWILKFANPNYVTDTVIGSVLKQKARYTPLGEACKAGNFEMVKLLVEDGADVNYAPKNTLNSPLGFAVRSDSADNLKIVKYLIEAGADVNYSKGTYDFSAALTLIDRELRPNGMEILKTLLEAGSDPEKEHFLISACSNQDEEAIRYLVNEWGYDASDPACIVSYCYGFDECSYETFEFFLERGANPYKKYCINKFIGEKNAIECLQEKSPEWAEKLIDLAEKYGITE